MKVLGLALLVMIFGVVAPARAEDPVSGFSTEGTGIVSGLVTDQNGEPMPGVTVYATIGTQQRSTTTDSRGRFRLDLGQEAGSKLVFVRERARISGHTLRSAVEDGEEYFDILEANKPEIPPKPMQATNLVPEYSQTAIASGVWTRAWLMLEVTDNGYVRRLKLLNPPGHGLDDIAIREAFKLRFHPARNRAGKAIATLVLWTFEWPSTDWLRERKLTPGYVPNVAAQVPCKGQSHQLMLRDCSQANLAAAQRVEWIDAPMAVPDIPPPPPLPVVQRKPQWYDDRLGWFLSGTGLGFVILGTALIKSGYNRAEDAKTYINSTTMAIHAMAAEQRKTNGWMMLGLGVTAMTAGIARLALITDGESATVAVSGSF